ncbi:hypothetical protein DXC28_04375 [Ruminococcus sp. OM08-9BH]|jgi:hypothetical protein|nr:hypothetical protein DXC28_04375 [Ruminococcus sp. OM08-9BH]
MENKAAGISGGISYGALGMSHHSAQDIAAMSAIPNMRVYLPSDRFQTAKLIEALLKDEKPAYIRVGRNPVEDIYTEDNCPFEMDKATVLTDGTDAAIIACGEMVRLAYEAAKLLEKDGIHATVLDMYCVKPLDKEAIVKAASNAKVVVTAEEHAPFGGLGSMVSQVVGAECPRKVLNIALPDAPVVSGDSQGALFGQGCIEKGMVKATYGTGSSVMMNAGTEPIMSDLGLVTSLAWGLNGKITYQITDIVEMMKAEDGMTVKELCVDGGPTRNQYLMKFQSDILGTTVSLPRCEESSAFGAGLMAGLSCGLYKMESIFEVKNRNQFIPSMNAVEREQKYSGWKNAVEKVLV